MSLWLLSSLIPGSILSRTAEYYWHYSLLELFMRQLKQPQVLIQHGSYLQRCRSHSVVPVIAIPSACRQILAPTLAVAMALAFSTAWQFRLYKPRWQKIRIVCYYNASPQWPERALFWLWEQSTVAIKQSLAAKLPSSSLTPSLPCLFTARIPLKMSPSDPHFFTGKGETPLPLLFYVIKQRRNFLLCLKLSPPDLN